MPRSVFWFPYSIHPTQIGIRMYVICIQYETGCQTAILPDCQICKHLSYRPWRLDPSPSPSPSPPRLPPPGPHPSSSRPSRPVLPSESWSFAVLSCIVLGVFGVLGTSARLCRCGATSAVCPFGFLPFPPVSSAFFFFFASLAAFPPPFSPLLFALFLRPGCRSGCPCSKRPFGRSSLLAEAILRR